MYKETQLLDIGPPGKLFPSNGGKIELTSVF